MHPFDVPIHQIISNIEIGIYINVNSTVRIFGIRLFGEITLGHITNYEAKEMNKITTKMCLN